MRAISLAELGHKNVCGTRANRRSTAARVVRTSTSSDTVTTRRVQSTVLRHLSALGPHVRFRAEVGFSRAVVVCVRLFTVARSVPLQTKLDLAAQHAAVLTAGQTTGQCGQHVLSLADLAIATDVGTFESELRAAAINAPTLRRRSPAELVHVQITV